jgi:hypothetical protein
MYYIDPVDFTPDTIQGIIVPKADKSNWWNTAVSLGRATRNISCYIEPILLESDEDSPIYREVMRTGVAV